MQADPIYRQPNKVFWAHVRLIGQALGYTQAKRIRTYTLADVQRAMTQLELDSAHLVDPAGQATALGAELVAYLAYRATILNTYVAPRLMNGQRAEQVFHEIASRYAQTTSAPIPYK